MLTRRKVLQILSTLPLSGLMVGQMMANDSGAEMPLTGTIDGDANPNDDSIYRSLGVEPVINCRGTFTIIGGSVKHEHVLKSMSRATSEFVQMDELAFGVGTRLAELTGAEWGIITAGCAAALKHITAGCISGGNPEKLIRIPHLTGVDKNEVIMPRGSRTIYDHAIRNTGGEIVMVETLEELRSAIGPRTAMICIMSWQSDELRTENVANVAGPLGVPILVDAAAEDLTIPNVHLQAGADVVAYSGGKAMLGPQSSGIAIGRKDILMAAWQASSPHQGPGRDNKVDRDELIGGLAAVEAWIMRDHNAEWQRWLRWLNNIGERVSDISGVSTEIQEPEGLNNRTPRLAIRWDPDQLNITGEEVAEELGRTKPRIALGSRTTGEYTSINITSGQMQPGDYEVVRDRIYNVLSKRRNRRPQMERPAAEINGRWNVHVKFYLGESDHTFIVEKQDGNWVWGSHRGDFATRDMAGTIEGNQVKLVSVQRQPGNTVNYIFIGELNGDSMSGRLFMGQYLDASFTAKKHDYPDTRRPVLVPDGPPLAT